MLPLNSSMEGTESENTEAAGNNEATTEGEKQEDPQQQQQQQQQQPGTSGMQQIQSQGIFCSEEILAANRPLPSAFLRVFMSLKIFLYFAVPFFEFYKILKLGFIQI